MRQVRARGQGCGFTYWPVAPAGIKPCQTQNLFFVNYKKCMSTLLIQIWILDFCLCTALFFLPYSIQQNLTLTLVVSLRSCLPYIARYLGPGNCMKISLSLFSIFCLPKMKCWRRKIQCFDSQAKSVLPE